MLNLKQHIAELLFTHHCVIVADFGGFLGRETAFEVNFQQQTARPAKKGVAFNAQLREDDGLLAQHIAKRYRISHQEAVGQIADAVAALQKELSDKGNSLFSPLGTFYRTADAQLLFVADAQANFSAKHYGLTDLKLRASVKKEAVKQSSKPTVPEEKKSERRVDRQEVQRERRSFSGLNVINTLGSVFLMAIVFSLLNFELGNDALIPIVNQEAQLLEELTIDTQEQIESSTLNIKKLVTNYQTKPQLKAYRILLDGTFSKTEVENIREEISLKFPQSEIIELENKAFTISVISFMNEQLANEYRNLIQKNLEYELKTTAR